MMLSFTEISLRCRISGVCCLAGDPDTLLDETQRDNVDDRGLDHRAADADRRREDAEDHTAEPDGATGMPHLFSLKNVTCCYHIW